MTWQTYRQHGTQLRDASVALTQAVDLENFDAARAAIGNMQKACSNCHDKWR
ncbi:cytochrome c [Aeoliella sp. SH292]|uniref:cytochrome c n=1 Tax=Aeoliella sp. SH292 TaxID=3454464 RepID=UPI003F98DF3C